MATKRLLTRTLTRAGVFVSEGAQVEICGNDRYIAVCRNCWRNKRIEQAERNTLLFFELTKI